MKKTKDTVTHRIRITSFFDQDLKSILEMEKQRVRSGDTEISNPYKLVVPVALFLLFRS